MEDCLFCKIISGTIPSDKLYEDEYVIAFRDIYPQAPVHILVVPKKHIVSVADITAENSIFAVKCLEAAAIVAKQENLDNGFRVVSNSGAGGGQTIFHLHFHILAGKNFLRVGE